MFLGETKQLTGKVSFKDSDGDLKELTVCAINAAADDLRRADAGDEQRRVGLGHIERRYSTKHTLTLDACGDVPSGNQTICVSSLEGPTGKYAEESQCAFLQWWSNPTDLSADCRSGTSPVDVQVCKRPLDTPRERC